MPAKPTSKADSTVVKLDNQKKTRLIQFFRETYGHVTDSCQAVGISRTAFYNWIEKDKEFAQAIMDARAELGDEMEHALIEKARAQGDTASLIFWLKSRHPDYKQSANTLIQVNSSKDMQVEFLTDESNIT